MLESYYQIYSSDEEAEITHRLCEEDSSGRENIERLQAAEAKAKTPTEVEEDQNTTGTDFCMILLFFVGNLPSYQVKSETHHNIFVRDAVLLG